MPVDETSEVPPAGQEGVLAELQGIEDRLAAFAATQELQLEDLRQLVEQLRLEQRQAEAEIVLYGEQATSCANEALARADEALQRLAALAAASGVSEAVEATRSTDLQAAERSSTAVELEAFEQRLAQIVGQQDARLGELRERLAQSVQELEQRVAGSVNEHTTRIEELRQRFEVAQRHQQSDAEVAARGEQVTSRANAALVRAEEALQRIERLSAAPPVPETTADEAARRAAAWEAVVQSVRDVEQRVAGATADQHARLEALGRRLEHVQRQHQETTAEAGAQAGHASALASQALAAVEETRQRLDAATAAAQARDADTTVLLRELSAAWEALNQTVGAVEQRVATLAHRQESDMGELRQLVDQARCEQGPVVEQIHIASAQAATRADEALRRAEAACERNAALVDTSRAREADTMEVLGRLSRGWEALSQSVCDVQQRVVEVATRQESELDELRQRVEHVHHEQRQLADRVSAQGEQVAVRATEALARADEAVGRIGTITATAQAREAATTEMLSRLSAGWETLNTTVRDVEQRLAARHEAGVEEVRQLVDQVQRELRRPAVERAASREPTVPERRAVSFGVRAQPSPLFRSWLALTAPGALLALGLLVLLLAAAPWLSGVVHVATKARLVAGFLLLAHGVVAYGVLKRGGQWLAAAAVVAVLAVDAFGAGVVCGADLRLNSPGVPLCLTVLVMSVMAGGSMVGLASTLIAAAGAVAAHVVGLGPLVGAPALLFATTLSVETSFGNVPALATGAPAFATMLSVETTYAGRLVTLLGSSASLFVPVLAVALMAMCIGVGVNLLWARKARGVVDAELDPVHRSMVRA